MLKSDHYWIQITTGQGPEECTFAAREITKLLLKEARELKLDAELLDTSSLEKYNCFSSCLMSLKGNNLSSLKDKWEGSIKWICKSPFRPNHQRKNWFIGIDFFKAIEEENQLNHKDIRFETMRASGPGGQHVNTTDSAVRVTHMPTGLNAIAREERSQFMNKKLALARLNSLLEQRNTQAVKDGQYEQWLKHRQLERGNPIRIFIGKDFKEK